MQSKKEVGRWGESEGGSSRRKEVKGEGRRKVGREDERKKKEGGLQLQKEKRLKRRESRKRR